MRQSIIKEKNTMEKLKSDRQKLEDLYEIAKDLTSSEAYIVKSNAWRIIGIVRILLAELNPDRIIEHPVGFE
jgi:hypothetical protein